MVCTSGDKLVVFGLEMRIVGQVLGEKDREIVIKPLSASLEIAFAGKEENTPGILRGFNLHAPFHVHEDVTDRA